MTGIASRAGRLGDRVAKAHGASPWAVAERIGLPVLRESLPAPYREVYFNLGRGSKGIILSPTVQDPDASELLAHGLGHHYLHCGNRLRKGPAIWTERHEREADDFASCLLLPASRLLPYLGTFDSPDLRAVAEELGLSPSLIARRLRLSEFPRRDWAPA